MERGLQMRQDDNGRKAVYPWSDAPQSSKYAVGDVVCSGASRGTVTIIEAGTIAVVWTDAYNEDLGAIVYPEDATYLRKALPWEC
jgi:hypothetical protein